MWLIFFFQQWQQELQQQRLIFHHFVISPRKPLRLLPCSDRLVYSCWGTIIRGISNTKDKWKRAETWMIWQFKEWKDKEKKNTKKQAICFPQFGDINEWVMIPGTFQTGLAGCHCGIWLIGLGIHLLQLANQRLFFCDAVTWHFLPLRQISIQVNVVITFKWLMLQDFFLVSRPVCHLQRVSILQKHSWPHPTVGREAAPPS